MLLKQRGGEGLSLPMSKQNIEHKKSISVTIKPENVEEIYKHFEEWGYRSVSHLVDDAISRLIKIKEEVIHDSKEN
jgi:hypothetical protein